MSEFKVGQTIRVINAEPWHEQSYKNGDMDVITEVDDDMRILHTEKFGQLFFHEAEIAMPVIFLDGQAVAGVGLSDFPVADGLKQEPDMVAAPPHYARGGVEPIEYMAQVLPSYDDAFVGFCAGNVIKYTSRAPHKGTQLQDLKKARQYLDFAINHIEKGSVK